MPYATLQQLTDRYGEQMMLDVADRAEPAAGVVDGDVVARALADTDAMIDGYLEGRYALPLTTVPPLLVDLALKIAIWNLHRFSPEEKIKDDYLGALKSLEKIASGTIQLSVAGVVAPGAGGTGARMVDRERPLTAENLKGYI